MKLVEPEVGPVDGDDARVTPPRPLRRRVSVSLLFTLSVLSGTVAAIYTWLPPRNNVFVTEAIARHREPGRWDLERPTAGELRAWAIGAIGLDAPLPPPSATILGAKRLELLDRTAGLIGLELGGDRLTYLVQHARGMAPDHVERERDELRAVAWRLGKFRIVVVGPTRSAARWEAVMVPE